MDGVAPSGGHHHHHEDYHEAGAHSDKEEEGEAEGARAHKGEAAAHGVDDAAARVAALIEEGCYNLSRNNTRRAKALFAACGDDCVALAYLGCDFTTSVTVFSPELVKRAWEMGLQARVDAGNRHAQYCAGTMALRGTGFPRDHRQAFLLLSKAADQNHPHAIHFAGRCLEMGWGVDKDARKALRCFEKGARLGCVASLTQLGYCIRDASSLHHDPVKARQLFTQAAMLGFAVGLNNLGDMFGVGDAEKDVRRAAQYFRKATLRSSAIAQRNLNQLPQEDDPVLLGSASEAVNELRGGATAVYLRANSIDLQGLRLIAAAVARSNTVREVDLDRNPLGPEGASIMAKVAKEHPSLSRLWMQGCGIGNEGADYLLEALDAQGQLDELYIADTEQGDERDCIRQDRLDAILLRREAVLAKRAALRHNGLVAKIAQGKGIVDLSGSASKVSAWDPEEVPRAVKFAVSNSPNVIGLKLEGRNLGAWAPGTLTQFLQDKPTVKEFFLNDNGLSVKAGQAIVDMLRSNGDIQVLHCERGNSVKSSDVRRIRELTARNCLARHESVPVQQAKLFVCGAPAVGKTTLVRSLDRTYFQSWRTNEDKARSAAPSERTRGIEVQTIVLRDDKEGRLSVWDCAGQTEYYVTHELFVGGADGPQEDATITIGEVFMVVCDLSVLPEEWSEQLQYWLRFVKMRHHAREGEERREGEGRREGEDQGGDQATDSAWRGDKPQVLVVGTNIDTVKKRCGNNDQELTKLLGLWQRLVLQHKERFERWLYVDGELLIVDARKSNSPGVESVRARLRGCRSRAIHRNMRVPAICRQVIGRMDALRKQFPPAVSLDDLRKVISAGNPALSGNELDAVITFLELTGEVIWFCQDPVLRELVVISPQWLCNHVIGTLLAPESFPRPGLRQALVSKSDIARLVGGDVDVGLVTRLLLRLQLCFEVDCLPTPANAFDLFGKEVSPSGSVSSSLLFPALLPDRLPSDQFWDQAWGQHITPLFQAVGRRVAVVNEATDMLGDSAFPKLQVRARGVFGDQLDLPSKHVIVGVKGGARCVLEMCRSKTWLDVRVGWEVGSSAEAHAMNVLNEMMQTAQQVLQECCMGCEVEMFALSVVDLMERTNPPNVVRGFSLAELLAAPAQELQHPVHPHADPNHKAEAPASLLGPWFGAGGALPCTCFAPASRTLGQQSVVVVHDARPSSQPIASKLRQGLTSKGLESVVMLGEGRAGDRPPPSSLALLFNCVAVVIVATPQFPTAAAPLQAPSKWLAFVLNVGKKVFVVRTHDDSPTRIGSAVTHLDKPLVKWADLARAGIGEASKALVVERVIGCVVERVGVGVGEGEGEGEGEDEDDTAQWEDGALGEVLSSLAYDLAHLDSVKWHGLSHPSVSSPAVRTNCSHVMLSYQWDSQALVERVYQELTLRGFNVWMDIHNGIQGDIYKSMARGVRPAACVVCFFDAKYEASTNCQREVNAAADARKPIVPVRVDPQYRLNDHLAVIFAGLKWLESTSLATAAGFDQLAAEIEAVAGVSVRGGDHAHQPQQAQQHQQHQQRTSGLGSVLRRLFRLCGCSAGDSGADGAVVLVQTLPLPPQPPHHS